MEKDNKKARDDARRDYNDTVRVSLVSGPSCNTSNDFFKFESLAKYIRKRDPRYKTHLSRQAKAKTSGTVTPSTNKPKKPSTAQAVDEYIEQEWQKVDTRGLHDDLEWAVGEGEDPEEWECVACNKTFRSEAAWDSHERSKKHMAQVEALRREMQEENNELDLDLDLEELQEVSDTDDAGTDVGSESLHETTSPAAPSGELPRIEEATSENNLIPLAEDFQDKVTITDADEEWPDDSNKRKSKKSRKPSSKPLLTKTERKALDLEERTHIASSVVSEDLQATQFIMTQPTEQVPAELSKRDKRRAREAKKAEAGKVRCQHISSLH